MKLGWVADFGPKRIGGADLSRQGLVAQAPAGVEVVLCTPQDFDAGCDGYIVVSPLLASKTQLELLAQVPHIVTPRDLWTFGLDTMWKRDPWALNILRTTPLTIFMSPLHANKFKERHMGGVNVRGANCISAFDPDPFLALHDTPKLPGNLWVGDFANTMRGLRPAIEWCMERGERLDVLGYGGEPPEYLFSGKYSRVTNLLQTVPHSEMPGVYATHTRLISLPTLVIDPCGRAVMEATLAGLEVIATPETTGVMSYEWWAEAAANPELLAVRLRESPARFWGFVAPAIETVIRGKG